MTTTTLRKKVHQYVDGIDIDLLEAVYNILKICKHDDEEQSRLTKGQKSSLDKTLSEHKAGKLKYYTIEQAKAAVDNK